ncbi:hypothetical protein K504DRAFT_426062 [Pleomassaria siparia CBS 279.74]|uniref:Uncharacterized protein n=1 Tax=Pleomassaria siparia CBS 279.74 TaxID=1314801 RepID=A0A6G1KI14_9PLEO|nr:hypothetical protein K504DRAFT_426062 [Pleomassaria siparia CBS 279.74]
MQKIFATSVAAAVLAAASTHFLLTWQQISSTDLGKISASSTAAGHLRDSKSVSSIVNPNKHISRWSRRSIEVNIAKGISDEEILARYVKGFFGGYVLAPERAILRTLRLNIIQSDKLEKLNACPPIWSASQISSKTLPPLHTVLFSAFQVVDIHIEEPSPRSQKTHSCVDFAFGSDTFYIAGVHRFSVWRNAGVSESVKMEYSDTAFNPKAKQTLPSQTVWSFHLVYAMVLFREAVARVMRN